MSADRITLAEAMGWTGICESLWGFQPNHPNVTESRRQIPDPFTNANDDYAVLEWIRAEAYTPNSLALTFSIELRRTLYAPEDYKIGDYARAALKVITTEQDTES